MLPPHQADIDAALAGRGQLVLALGATGGRSDGGLVVHFADLCIRVSFCVLNQQCINIAESTRVNISGCVCVSLGEVDALNKKRAKLLLPWHQKEVGVGRVGSASSRVFARYDTAKEQDFDVRAPLFV